MFHVDNFIVTCHFSHLTLIFAIVLVHPKHTIKGVSAFTPTMLVALLQAVKVEQRFVGELGHIFGCVPKPI